MKSTVLTIIMFFTFFSLVSCQKAEGVFARENDTVTCDCTEQSIEQIVLCDGEWRADCSATEWVTVSPECGSGNGKDYGTFNINVRYNSGPSREGTVNLIYNGKSYPIKIIQGECEFAYGTPVFDGNLFQNIASEAKICIPYSCASGQESVVISCVITGNSSGIDIEDMTYQGFVKGEGVIEIPVAGTPLSLGTVMFEIIIDGTSVGHCSSKILEDPDAVPEGFPAGWNFYSQGISPLGSEYDYSWSQSAVNKTDVVLPYMAHKVLPTFGNKNSYLTAYSNTVSSVNNYVFNPSIQIRGLKKDDYFLMVIPVRNIKPSHSVKVEACFGGAGSAAGYFVLEYSDDEKSWYCAEGSETMTVFGETAAVHYRVTQENASTERKTYNKETDTGYRSYVFPLSGISTIFEGNIYFRLRVAMDRRAIGSEATNIIADNAWCDLKGFEVQLVED